MGALFRNEFTILLEDEDAILWKRQEHVSLDFVVSKVSGETRTMVLEKQFSDLVNVFVRCWKDEHLYEVFYEINYRKNTIKRKMHYGHLTEGEVDNVIKGIHKDLVDNILFGINSND